MADEKDGNQGEEGRDEITPEELSRYAKHLVSKRRRDVPGTCAVCGKPFVGTAKRKFCSHTCAQRDYYARHRSKPEGSER
jgi:hypothetical protein